MCIRDRYQVDGGQIFFKGEDFTHLPAHKRAKMGLGRTFQQPRFNNRASIEDNLKVGTDLRDQIGYKMCIRDSCYTAISIAA